MDKTIFKKMNLKKSYEKDQSQNKIKQDIVSMSVKQIQNSLIDRINQSQKNRESSRYQQNNSNRPSRSENQQKIQQNNTQKERKSFYSNQNSQSATSKQSKQIPQLMFQNEEMKQEIQKLKKQKQLIMQKYQNALTLSRKTHNQEPLINPNIIKNLEKKQKKNEQFSFRRSIDQAERESLIPHFQKKQFIQDFFEREPQHENSKLNQNYKNQINPQIINSSLQATLPVSFSLPNNKNGASLQMKFGNKMGKSVQTRHENQNGVEMPIQDGLQKNKQQILNENYIKFRHKLNSNSNSLEKNQNLISKSRSKFNSNSVKLSLEDKFYEYCKNQIIKVNSQNAKLNLKLGELQNKLTTLLKQNQNIKFINQHLTQTNSNIENSLNQYKNKLQKMSMAFEDAIKQQQQNHSKERTRLQKNLNQYVLQKCSLKEKLAQKQKEISTIRTQLKHLELKCQNLQQALQKKAYVEIELNDSLNRNKKLKEKYIKSTAIDHLWEIKQIEYAGIMQLIQKSRLKQ